MADAIANPSDYLTDSNGVPLKSTFLPDLKNLGPSALYLLKAARDRMASGNVVGLPDNSNLNQQQQFNDTMASLMKMNPNSMQSLQQARILKMLQSGGNAQASVPGLGGSDE